MYNLNVSLATPSMMMLGVDGAIGATPRTPEILNSLIAMTNPLDDYSYEADNQPTQTSTNVSLIGDWALILGSFPLIQHRFKYPQSVASSSYHLMEEVQRSSMPTKTIVKTDQDLNQI